MDSVEHLNYAPKPPAAEAYLRRGYRVAIVTGLAAMIFLWGPGVFHRAVVRYWQQRCLTYHANANRRVYECDLTMGLEIYREVNYDQAAFEQVSEPGTGKGWTMPAIFLHEMRQPDGQRRLVVVNVPRFSGAGAVHATVYNLQGETLTMGWMSQPKSSGLLVLPIDIPEAARSIQFFEGELDDHNPSHLTFDFEIDGVRHTCDGWLNDGDQLIVAPRP